MNPTDNSIFQACTAPTVFGIVMGASVALALMGEKQYKTMGWLGVVASMGYAVFADTRQGAWLAP